MACACCQPLHCTTCPPPPPADFANVRLTVRLLSGSLLAKLVVELSTVVADLKLRIEKAAQLPPGRVVRWLTWGATELPDDASLQEVGFAKNGELVAMCADAVVGDFEVYMPGCPTCDYNCELQSVRLFADGAALIQTGAWESEGMKFRYRLGELKGAERQLEFVEDEAVKSPTVYAGILHVSTTNPIYRRIKIPELDIAVEDVRYLKQKGLTVMQQKMEIFFECLGGPGGGFERLYFQQDNFRSPSAISCSADEVWEAYSQAWTRWEKLQKEEEVSSLAELYDGDHARQTQSDRRRKQQNKAAPRPPCSNKKKRVILRWERPKLMM